MTPRSSAGVPDRVRWALEVLDPGPADRVLEIGSGSGVAAAVVCARLETGRMLAVDRSPLATRRTAERNAEQVAAGRLEVRTVALDDLDVPPAGFDAAFSMDVNLFWTRVPTRELEVVRHALRPGGALHVCFGTGGPQRRDRVTEPVALALRGHGFTEVRVRTGNGGVAVSGRTRSSES